MKPAPARHFASDNYSGACPEVMAAIQAANQAHAPAYGGDPWTARATELIRQLFDADCEVFFVFNGTSANSLSLAGLCESYSRVICYSHSHLVCDECGAPGFFTHGLTLQGVSAPDGKLTPDLVAKAAAARTDIHHSKATALSITQATELGTVYSLNELKKLGDTGLRFHMDGARIANAIASLGCSPKEITWKIGADVLCFGGTKNGAAAAELVIFFKKELSREFDYRLKQAGQLASKTRFLAAQWLGLLQNDVWLRNAKHANAMARKLAERLRAARKIEIVLPVEANALFVRLSEQLAHDLNSRGWDFYKFIEPDLYRVMCAWATTETEIDQFVGDVLHWRKGIV